jgi:DNA polymerase-3 subunit delta'
MRAILLHPNAQKRFEQICENPPQSILLIAPVGSGKKALLRKLSTDLLGQHAAGRLFVIEPEPDKSTIGIEQIRQIKSDLRLKSDSLRIILINEASRLTDEAQNSLLKLLEEPPEFTLFLLSANTPNELLPTIRSRTLLWRLTSPTKDQILNHFANYDQAKVTKAYAISDGRIGLMSALLDGEDEHPLLQAIDIAKEILGETHFERLVRVDALVKDANGLQLLLEAMVLVSKAALEHAASANAQSVKQWHRRLVNTLAAQDQLAANVQPKLVLSHLFVVV